MEIRTGTRAEIDQLKELWASMHAHHAALAGEVAPVRPLDESWRLRRAQYEEWLAGEDAQLILAQDGDRLVGYAVVRVGAGAATWDLGDRVGELESLAVLEPARGSGVGAALVAAARAFGRERGAERLIVSVVHNNEGALRFYEREGFGPFYVLLAGAGS